MRVLVDVADRHIHGGAHWRKYISVEHPQVCPGLIARNHIDGIPRYRSDPMVTLRGESEQNGVVLPLLDDIKGKCSFARLRTEPQKAETPTTFSPFLPKCRCSTGRHGRRCTNLESLSPKQGIVKQQQRAVRERLQREPGTYIRLGRGECYVHPATGRLANGTACRWTRGPDPRGCSDGLE